MAGDMELHVFGALKVQNSEHKIWSNLVKGLLGTDPPGTHPQIRPPLLKGQIGIDSTLISRLDPISMPNRPFRRGGRVDPQQSNRSFCRILGIFLQTSASEKKLGLWNMATPYAPTHTPTTIGAENITY